MLETLVSDLKDSFAVEKQHILGRIAELKPHKRKQVSASGWMGV